MSQDAIYRNGSYLSSNPTWHEEDSPWKARQVARMLGKNGIVPSSVCEVGCGAGGILASLAAEYGDGVQFSGYEISPQAVEICEKKRRPNLRFFLKNLFDEPAPAFDVVLAIDVLEHVEDYFGFLRKLKGCGTYKLLHIPLDLSVQSMLRSSILLNSRASVGHIHYFTKETALATLKDAGYEVIDHSYTAPSLELPDLPWETRLMHLPRRLLFALHRDWAARILGGFSLLVLAK
jgi:SAM-dependent methyltransferase